MRQRDLRALKQDPQKLQEAAASIDPNTLRNVQQTIMKYNGKDKTQLMEELRVMATRERANGNLSDAQVDMIAGALGSMLDNQQREQLESIIRQIKGM